MPIINLVYEAPKWWQPLNPMCWYKFDWDYTDSTWNFWVASWTSTFQTLSSGIQVLQTDGSNLVLLPSWCTDTAINTYTIAFWMKTITTSPSYWYYAWAWNEQLAFYESTSWRCFYDRPWWAIDKTVSWLTDWWRLVIIRCNWTTTVNQLINGWNSQSTTGSTGSIFWYSYWFAIWWRWPTAATSTWQRTSIQMSNFVISHSYWDDATCIAMYDGTKSNYWL